MTEREAFLFDCTPFRVVAIPDEQSVIINAGTGYDIQCGDIFEVYCEGAEVIDPVTQMALGKLDCVKAKIEVIRAYTNMSHCKSAEWTNSLADIAASAAIMTQSFNAPRRRALNVDETAITGEVMSVSDKIRIGDLVRFYKGRKITDDV